jgi:isopropylmalate/homocitrate/citramalate synthase
VDRIRLVDTVGSASPEAIGYLVGHIKGIVGHKVALEIHCHDDFGLGAASTVRGAACGADVLSTTINGLGERAGNTATEEVLVALKLLYGVDLGVDLSQLCEVSEMVERLGNAPLQRHKAVVGKHAFTHETGMTVAGVLEEPFVAEAYAPELVGQKRGILIGKKSGVKSIEAKLKEKGIYLPEEKLRSLLTDVKSRAVKLKGALSDEEFLVLARPYA